jgi:putative Mn2+ efflux pump MntP
MNYFIPAGLREIRPSGSETTGISFRFDFAIDFHYPLWSGYYSNSLSGDTMSLITVFFIAVALAMDAFAVSITSGVTICRMHLRHALRIAAFLGGFQALMPIIGWSLGRFAADAIMAYDHWIAFSLLAFVGGKMSWEALICGGDEDEDEVRKDPLNLYILLTLAFATSIDAAAVGISLSFLKVDIIEPSIIIGVITFFISLAGTFIGCRFGDKFGSKIEIIGGLALIGIGIKIVIDHQFPFVYKFLSLWH